MNTHTCAGTLLVWRINGMSDAMHHCTNRSRRRPQQVRLLMHPCAACAGGGERHAWHDQGSHWTALTAVLAGGLTPNAATAIQPRILRCLLQPTSQATQMSLHTITTLRQAKPKGSARVLAPDAHGCCGGW